MKWQHTVATDVVRNDGKFQVAALCPDKSCIHAASEFCDVSSYLTLKVRLSPVVQISVVAQGFVDGITAGPRPLWGTPACSAGPWIAE